MIQAVYSLKRDGVDVDDGADLVMFCHCLPIVN